MNDVTRASISWTAAVFFIVVGIVLWGGFNTALEATNTLEFCISCHEMRDNVYQEYKQSVHYRNPAGVQATCPDCHVPKEWVPKLIRKIRASKELFYWMTGEIDTREKFLAKRLELATHEWERMKAADSQECRNCHEFTAMDLANQARFAARIHGDAIRDKKTCIDCHKGIAHQLPVLDEEDVETVALTEDERDLGEEIMETCAACHGEYGQGDPNGEYPRLAGLDPKYLARQLRFFKDRTRPNIPMIPYANDRELPEEDLLVVAKYLASIELPTKLPPLPEGATEFDALERLEESKKVINIARWPGNVTVGGRVYRKECAGCHGEDALGDRHKTIPPLAGQRSQYLLRQIEKFRKGIRVHDDPRDAEIFRHFSDGEINDILAWLSVQDDESYDENWTPPKKAKKEECAPGEEESESDDA